MNAHNDPAVLFYTSDFLVGTMTMSNEQKGKYITLLCLLHQKGHLTKEEMLSICGDDAVVMSKFQTDEDGKYYNVRMDVEIEKRSAFIASKVENGKLGGRPKKEKPIANLQKTYSFPLAKANRNLSVNVNVNEDVNENNTDVTTDFDVFYEAYPKKRGKEQARKAWKKVDVPVDVILSALAWQTKSKMWTKSNGDYIPYPATYLNNRRWEDEPDLKAEDVWLMQQ